MAGDQDLQLREGLSRAFSNHAQNFEPHTSAECRLTHKKWLLPLSFMCHSVPPLTGDHIFEKVSLVISPTVISLLPLPQVFWGNHVDRRKIPLSSEKIAHFQH